MGAGGAFAIDTLTFDGGSPAGAGAIGAVGRSFARGAVGGVAFGAKWETGAAMRTGGISTLGESDAADVVGTPGALDTADAVLAGAETGRGAGGRGEAGAAAFAASGWAARATGSITAGIAGGRRPTGRWPAGLLAMGRLSMMGTEVDVAVGSTRSEVDDRVTCARAGAAAPTRAGRREEMGFFDGDGDRFAGNIGVPDTSELATSAAAATACVTTAGAADPAADH